ncbi:hypothetical protein CHS0354_040353 [Potamilus streckersoni]|uniref:FHA domain-containing protein n=1 Tax=Potamilus streckersoni TaxID=2493646 RepID=A0AAE0S1S4_9BIVA|nr:hypothetical protein CHS0354_040353 [Potamilus streckersoni]
MKAYLRTAEGSFYQLASKLTTIGKEGCDIVLQSVGVDQQHAVIEYSEAEDCYVLQDLNTAQGTYVNDVRVQNAAVRLAPGDVIRFGYSGATYELLVENPSPVSYPPVQQRPAWTQPLTLINDDLNYTMSATSNTHGLPYITTPTLTIPSAHWTPAATGPMANLPRPPLRSRPLSAGSARRTTFDRFQPIGTQLQQQERPGIRSSNGWIGSTSVKMITAPQTISSTGPPPVQQVDISLLQEKEQKILQLSEEVNRLRTVEMDSFHKEQQLQQLEQQVLDLQQRLSQQPPLIMGRSDVEITHKLVQLDDELTAKKAEIAALKEQLSHLQSETQNDGDHPVNLRLDLTEKMKEINNLRNELERVKKDKNITSGLVTQMQRDMSSKDSSISKLTREIEALKKEIRERDAQIASLSSKLSKGKDVSKPIDDKDAREKELISLRQKFKSAENKLQEQSELINNLREELDKMKASVFEQKDVQRKLQLEIEKAKSEATDFQRAERVVRVDLEQATKKLERFRNRVLQVTFSTPGIKAPDTEISDDELLETMKKIMDERTELLRKVQDMKDKVRLAETSGKDFQKNVRNIKKNLEDVVDHLRDNGRLSNSLKEEISLLQPAVTDESVAWVKDIIIKLLEGEMAWELDLEAAIEKCGVNVKLTNDAPGKHIGLLYAKWETALREKERLVKQISQQEEQYKQDLQTQLKAQKEEAQQRIADAVEKAKLEVEEKLNRAIDDIRAVETEKRENAVEAERKKIEELENSLEQLKNSLTEKNENQQEKLEAASAAMSELEEYKVLEVQLREEIAKLEAEKAEEVQRLRLELEEKDRKLETDLSSYKEQIKQHSVTICAMEERLTKITKKSKEYQEEVEMHKKTAHELKAELNAKKAEKPLPPPKPKIIMQKPPHDILAMEQLIVVLRKENAEIRTSIQEQEGIILGLRRDLAGAHARLSDITGEISESQKQEMEKYKEVVSNKEKEVVESRQHLAKLSRIIDKQKEELKALEAELSKERSVSVKYKSTMEEKTQKLKDLEVLLKQEKEEQNKQLELMDQEGRITSELTAFGAQCRGERHEQIITRQREALAELRSRVKSLETSKPPLPNPDQALQQVIALKKELAEMRANQALAEDQNIPSMASLDREVSRARGLVTTVNVDADMERSAHRETLDALDASENTFLSLLKTIAHNLECDDIDGLRPLAHIPKDERERVMRERERACEILTSRIKVMKERIARKDELLQGYERDLSKLRQAQELAEHKTNQVDSLATEVRDKSEESQYLRETLNRTKERLDQEKRLNKAIKQRKTFHLENESAHLHRPLSASRHKITCQPEDPRFYSKKKREAEALKKRNYEIKTLKRELTDRERALFESENRLYTIEHSMR